MRITQFLLAASTLALTACGGSPAATTSATTPADGAGKPAATTTAAAPDGWADTDLRAAKAKLPLVVKAPVGATFGESPLGGVEVKSEKLTFNVDDVTDMGADFVATQKTEVKTNSGMVFEKFALEQPDGFIAQMGAGNFIPCRYVTVGGRKYQFSVIPLNALASEAEAKQLYDLAALARAK